MAHIPFHNDTVAMNHTWFESQKRLIATVCIQLGHVDEIQELTKKLLGDELNIKPMKDPDKPKRAKSSYLFFCDDVRKKVRAELKKKGETVELGKVAQKLGSLWRALSDADKEPYKTKSQMDRDRYEMQMEEYNS